VAVAVFASLATSCTEQGNCGTGSYCDSANDCVDCDYITPSRCDALGGSSQCCTSFLAQCRTDPHQCSCREAQGAICSGHGTCTSSGDSFKCHCKTGYFGDWCQTTCPGGPTCSSHGTCTASGDSGATCSCEKGYSGAAWMLLGVAQLISKNAGRLVIQKCSACIDACDLVRLLHLVLLVASTSN
jgi:hypothetical protein